MLPALFRPKRVESAPLFVRSIVSIATYAKEMELNKVEKGTSPVISRPIAFRFQIDEVMKKALIMNE